LVQLINECKVLVVKPESKTLLGRPERRWEGDTEVEHKEMVWDGVNLIHLNVNTTMNVRIPTRLEITSIAK
jgi:hypothetical protein